MIACRRRGAFCKGVVSTPSRRGPTFVRAKVGKTRLGLCREMEVTAEGGGIQVPVGDRTLGRLFNVTGEILSLIHI